jgi:hypothetical protein
MLLSKEDQGFYLIRTGRLYEYSCDEPNCGRLIHASDLMVVLKWEKRTDGLTILGRIPKIVRCMQCQREKHPPKETVSVKSAGRGAKKVSAEIASTLKIDINVRKFVVKLLKLEQGGIALPILLQRLRKRKIIRELSKRDIVQTIRSMKKLKLIRKTKGLICLPKEKKSRKKVSNKA